MIPLLLALACGKDDAATGQAVFDLTEYSGLDADGSWVYRDDGSDELPDEATLLRARDQGGGTVELRRGYRWADADPVGEVVWDTSDGLTLTGLHLLPVAWTGSMRLADLEPANGDQQVRGGSHCVTDDTQVVSTYYADYDDVLVFDCTGDGLPGTYAFANGVGLVRAELDGLTVDLVAPW